MNKNTTAKFNKYIDPNTILSYIRKTWDDEAICTITDNDNNWETDAIADGFIHFSYNGHSKQLYYSHYKKDGNEYYGIQEAEETFISIINDEVSVNIITELTAFLGGGFVDKDDSDEIGFEYTEQKGNVYRLKVAFNNGSYCNGLYEVIATDEDEAIDKTLFEICEKIHTVLPELDIEVEVQVVEVDD